MKSMAMWSALGGGAACAVVAGVAIESAGGFAPLLAKFVSASPPAQILASPPAEPAPSPSPSADRPEASPALPAFDVVRVEKTGEAVIAGRAAPRASVELRDDGKALAEIAADDSGQFVIVPDPLATGDHWLQLAARVGDGPEALSKVVSVTVAAATAMAKPIAPKPTLTAAPALATLAKPSPSPTLAAAPSPVAAAPKPSPTAVALAVPSPSPATPPEPSASAAGRLEVVKVKTTDGSGLEAEGSANPGARLRLKLNGSFVAEVTANADGHWSLSIDHGLTTGFYALRAEALDSGGRPSSAAESTFAFAQRSAPGPAPAPGARIDPSPVFAPTPPRPAGSLVAMTGAPRTPVEPPAAADASHAMVAEIVTTTVTKGDNLWDLARHFYGDGLRYADIYRANSEQIHNPSLIFVGQVIVVPRPEAKTP